MNQNASPQQVDLWAALLICERLFHIYCQYADAETTELRELLDELWSVDVAQEKYTEADVSGIQSFLTSLYPNSGSGAHYVASGFLVSMVDVYDYLVDGSEAYIQSIRQQGLDSIRHHLELALFETDDAPREISNNERCEIEESVLLKREIAAQGSFYVDLQQDRKIEDIKNKYIYDPMRMGTYRSELRNYATLGSRVKSEDA